MLRISVLLACLTTVLCHGFGHPGIIVQQQSPLGGPTCRPVRSFVTDIQTVVQEQPVLKTIQQQQVQFLTQYKQRFVTVTTGTVAYVTTGVQSTIINTRTRILTERNTVTNTKYVYILGAVVTALVANVATSVNVVSQASYETVYTPVYVTTTLTTVTTVRSDQIVFEPVFETQYNFVADPVTTTLVEQIPDYSTVLVQEQGLPAVVSVAVDRVVYETEVLVEKAPLYVTTRIQAIEYHTVTAPAAANIVTIAADCDRNLISPVGDIRSPGAGSPIGSVGVGPSGSAGVVISPSTGPDPRVNGVAGLPLARTGDVAAATNGLSTPAEEPALVSPGVLLSSNINSVLSGTSSV